jgi:YidC/Oxa1 family membrane protein insertase
MNRNTIYAFLIILGSVIFFTSPTYQRFFTEKILKKEYKATEKKQKKIEKTERKNDKEKAKVEKEEEDVEIVEKDMKDSNSVNDTIQNEQIKVHNDTVWAENEKIKIGIEEKGAKIISIIMKDYKNEEGKNIDLIKKNKKGGTQVTIGNKHYEDEYFKYSGEEKNIKVTKLRRIEFINKDQEGKETKKTFVLDKNEYEIGMEIYRNDLPGEKLEIGWKCGIVESDKSKGRSYPQKKVIHYFNGKNVQHQIMKKEEKDIASGTFEWVGITSKYFFIAINNEKTVDSDISIESIKEDKKNKRSDFNYSFSISKIADKQKEEYMIYAGPTIRKELKKYNLKYEKIMFPVLGFGRIFFWSEKWFPSLAEKVLQLLLLIQSGVKDYGIAILLLTIIIRAVTYPLTLSSMKSMEKMKDIQPKVNKIREKHKNNPQKMNTEIMNLYKKEGVNPLNPGCLPIFLQMPVLISLFVVLRKAIEIRGADTFLIPWIHDLSQPEVLFSLEKIIPNGIPMYGTNVALLPILNAAITFFQQKMTIKDPNQKAMIYFMPIFILVLFNSFPSGLVMYWTFSSAIQLVQQIIMNKNKKQ